MLLPKTSLALPDWVAAQNPSEWLTPPELAVLSSWSSSLRRTEWLAGRMAAKKLVEELLGHPPLDFSIGREGEAPCFVGLALPALSLSLSHSAGLGAATISDRWQEGTAGIDVQRVRPVRPGLDTRILTGQEREQIALRFGSEEDPKGTLLLWALKEAAIKARRLAWGKPLKEIEVRLTEVGAAVIKMTGESPMAATYEWLDGWWLARAVRPPLNSSVNSLAPVP